MAVTSVNTSNCVDIVSIIYTPDGFLFSGNLEADLSKRCVKRILAKYPPRSAWLVCMYYFPAGSCDLNWHTERFKGKGDNKTGYQLTLDDVRTLYANWRRCYSLKYTCTSGFALHTYDPTLRMLYPDNHLTFDIRLGYAIQMDHNVLRSIGEGTEIFKPIPVITNFSTDR
jgi:hypothetical protein